MIIKDIPFMIIKDILMELPSKHKHRGNENFADMVLLCSLLC